MSENFKAGDEAICNDNGGMQGFLTVGKQYEVKSLSNGYLQVVQDNGVLGSCFSYRFGLVKEPVTNGVNAEGQPIFFDLTNLKPFMRVERKEGTFGIYVGDVGNEGHCVIGDFLNGSTWTSEFEIHETCEDYSSTVAVYAAPEYAGNYLDVAKKGKLLWKRQAPKTAEQLAQEKATAERKAAIEEAEKALKLAQEKLEQLKSL